MNELLTGSVSDVQDFGDYDLRLFDDFDDMRLAIRQRDSEFKLARLLAGYAWEWRSRKDRSAFDIELGQSKMQWNRKTVDWVNSKTSLEEVGSIHTIQGYDLNYAGVVIGGDLSYDRASRRTVFNRHRYFDARGKANNNMEKRPG